MASKGNNNYYKVYQRLSDELATTRESVEHKQRHSILSEEYFTEQMRLTAEKIASVMDASGVLQAPYGGYNHLLFQPINSTLEESYEQVREAMKTRDISLYLQAINKLIMTIAAHYSEPTIPLSEPKGMDLDTLLRQRKAA